MSLSEGRRKDGVSKKERKTEKKKQRELKVLLVVVAYILIKFMKWFVWQLIN